MDKKEFKQMVEAIGDAEKLIGVIDYSLNEKRKKQRRYARSLYISSDIKKSEDFTLENIKSERPFYGLHP
ncbi:pseudaminic acid synthase, partial [Aliarcobacter butzleri]